MEEEPPESLKFRYGGWNIDNFQHSVFAVIWYLNVKELKMGLNIFMSIVK
jgi:hypothetical protein